MLLSVCIFIIYFFSGFVLYRPASDDFYFMTQVNELGIIGGVKFEFENINSRFASVFLMYALLYFYQLSPHFPLIYGFIILAGSLLISFFLFQSVITRFGILLQHKLLYSAWFVVFIYFSTTDIGEVWYWLSSAPTNLFLFFSFITVVAAILHPSNNWKIIIPGGISAGYMAAASEASIFYIILIILAIYFFRRKIPEKNHVLKTKILILVYFVVFTIVLTGSGLYNRMQLGSQTDLLYSFILNFKMCGIIILKYIPKILVPAFFGISFLSLSFLNENIVTRKPSFAKSFILFLIFIILSLYFFQLMFTKFTSDVMAHRTFFTLWMVLLVMSMIPLIHLYTNLSPIVIKRLQALSISVFIVYQLVISVYTLPTTVIYANAYDERTQFIHQNIYSDSNQILFLRPLPPQGMLYSAEITNDTLHYRNQHMKMYYGRTFKLK